MTKTPEYSFRTTQVSWILGAFTRPRAYDTTPTNSPAFGNSVIATGGIFDFRIGVSRRNNATSYFSRFTSDFFVNKYCGCAAAARMPRYDSARPFRHPA